MTYRDKFRAEHPNGNADMIHIFDCPRDLNTGVSVDCPNISSPAACRACWDREMGVTEDGKETLPR